MNRPDSQPPETPVCVVHVVENLEVGGLERLLVDFARHADRSRFALRVVTLGARGHLAGDFEAQGFPVEALDARPGLRPRSVLRLAGLFRRWHAGVVHTHSEGPYLYGVTAARLAGVPRVIHTRHHGPDIGNPPHVLRTFRFLSRWVDRIACVAENGHRHAIGEGISANKLLTVWNGIDTARFELTGPKDDGPAVIVARLHPDKDHIGLMDTVATILKVEPDFRLEVAGDGECRPAVEARCRELGLGHAVTFLGRVDDVATLLGRARMLILSSTKEGVSIALLEAKARGLPVVATDAGGNAEVVEHGKTGLIVPMSKPDELAAAILQVWSDPETGRRMGMAGRERVERYFDIRKTVAVYERLYGDEPVPDDVSRRHTGLPARALA